MIVPDNYLLIGGVAVGAVLALLVFFALRKRRAVPTPAVSLVLPQKGGVNDFDLEEYMKRQGMEKQPEARELHIPKTIQTDAMSLFFEEIIREGASRAGMTFRIKTPEGATIDLFGKQGWKLEGEIEIGGGVTKEEEKPKPKAEKPEDVT